MTTATITTFKVKSHDAPDETRTPEKTRLEVVHLDDYTLGRFTLEPGWKWSKCIKPVAKTDSCQQSHIGYIVSGQLTVQMDDGTRYTLKPGDSYTIPPGHDGWVEGDEPVTALEFASADSYAKK